MHPEPKKKPPLSSTINQTFGHSNTNKSNGHFQTAGGARVPSHLELLKPRSILPLPTNMIYQKRCNSARGQQLQVVDFNPFASGNDLGGIIGPSNVTYGTFDQQSVFDDSVFQTSGRSNLRRSVSPQRVKSRSP